MTKDIDYKIEKAAPQVGGAGSETNISPSKKILEVLDLKLPSSVGMTVNLSNIHSTIQNYEEDDERVIRKAYDPQMNLQNTLFLSS